MPLELHNLKPPKGAKHRVKRLGRGNSSGLGNYSGKGMKGQRARSGASGFSRRGLQDLMRNLPKQGGFTSLKPELAVVNLDDLEKNFKEGEIVDAKKLKSAGLIKSVKPGVKILGNGKLTKKLTLRVSRISASARQAVEKNNGKVIILSEQASAEKKDKQNKPDKSSAMPVNSKK